MEKRTIDAYLERYWEGETSLEEEQILRNYFREGQIAEEHKDAEALFSFFNSERDIVAQKAVSELVPQTQASSKAKIRHFNWTRIAASVMLVFTMLVGWNYFTSPTTTQSSVAVDEIQDPEEAYRVTMEALAYLSNKYDKGAKPLNAIKKVNATNIFNN